MALTSVYPSTFPGYVDQEDDGEAPPYTHKTTMALTKGDILVLVAESHDEFDRPRPFQYPVKAFMVGEIKYEPRFTYVIHTVDETRFLGASKQLELHRLLKIQPKFPVSVVRKPKGFCALFTLEVAHGYRIHYLDFVKNKLPEVYNQLQLS